MYARRVARRGELSTLGEGVHQRLRREVLTGVLRPGQRLQAAELAGRFHVSVGVMREALTRLAGNQLVVATPNHGFRVVAMTPDEIADLTRVRTTLECLALQMAIERGDLDWESQVVAAHHRLTGTPQSPPGVAAITSEAWAEAHADFHRTLIEACRVPSLLAMCGDLFDAMTLFRNSAPVSAGDPDAPADRAATAAAEHQAVVDAVLARDADLAGQHLATHFESTARLALDAIL